MPVFEVVDVEVSRAGHGQSEMRDGCDKVNPVWPVLQCRLPIINLSYD